MVRLREVGADRRPEVLRRSRLRAAADSRREARNGAAGEDQGCSVVRRCLACREFRSERSRLPAGHRRLRASSSCCSSCGIGFELARESMPSIQKFGLNFWRTEIWDPVAGEFGALPFIWGTLYSSVLALLIATPVALGIAVFISELCPGAAAAAARLPHRAARGHPVDRLRPVGHLRARAGGPLARGGDARLAAPSCRSSAGRRSASACCRRR